MYFQHNPSVSVTTYNKKDMKEGEGQASGGERTEKGKGRRTSRDRGGARTEEEQGQENTENGKEGWTMKMWTDHSIRPLR